MSLSVVELRKLPTKELLRILLSTNDRDRLIKPILLARLFAAGELENLQPQPQGSVADLAKRMKDSGWKGEGMTDPDGVLDWIGHAIRVNDSWENLPTEGAVRFWRKAETEWIKWQVRQERLNQEKQS